jgi:hypothetical protein
MRKLFRKLICRISGHKWIYGLALDNGPDCLRCGKHREWISLNVYDYFPELKDNLGDKLDVDLYKAFRDSCDENHEFLQLKHFNFCNGCGVKL